MRPLSVPRSTVPLISSSTFPTLAFGFVSPWLLWGLALGAVPILIQWLHRRNYTERVWAAMRFLRTATKLQSRRLRFESLLLLIIRTLILLLVAFALAEPFLEATGWLPQSPSRVHRLIVIDTSLSLQYEADARPLSERARDAARRTINQSRPGDSLQVVTIGRQGRALVGRPAYDAAEVLAQIERLRWTEEFGDVGGSLQLAQQLLDEASAAERTEVILISDFQRSNWWPQRTTQRSRVQRSLAELAASARLSLVQVGPGQVRNAALQSARISPLPVTLGESVDIQAQVLRAAESADLPPVQLIENDRVVQTASPGGDAAEEGTYILPARWREAGWHGLELRLPDDGLAADNHHWLAVHVRDELQVLLVNGRETGERLGRATDFVELALAPGSPSDRPAGTRNSLAYHPVVIGEAELARTELADFDCVFVCDVPFLSSAEQARLQTYVRGGGGLIIAAGPQVQLDAYNQWLNAAEQPLLPVNLLDVAGADDPEEPFRFAEPQPNASPIVEPFVGNPQAGLTTANIYRYVRTALRDAAPAPAAGSGPAERTAEASDASAVRVPLTFANADPAIVEGDFGAGRVLLVTTSLDDRWGSWALWPSFLPMMHRLVDHATAGAVPPPTLVGETVRREYPVQTVGLSATLQLPDGRRRSTQIRVEQGASVLQLDDLTQSGLYRVLLGPPLNRTELLAVNIDPRESDLRLLNERELQGTLLAGIDARLLRSDLPVEAAAAESAAPSTLSRWLLMVALVLLLVEQVMAWNARLGLISLLASPLVLLLFALSPVAAVVVLAAAALVLIGLRRWKRSAV